MSCEKLTRRFFIGATSATFAGALLYRQLRSVPDISIERGMLVTRDGILFQVQPPGPYIHSHRDNMAFGFKNEEIFLSHDNGLTWPYRCRFVDAGQIRFSHIFKNGNILFGTNTKLYLSNDCLEAYEPIVVKDFDDTDFRPHVPQHTDNPGWYFQSYTGVNSWDVDGVEMLVWGPYCNVEGGAAPVNIYYSTDNGQTVKIAYRFGQNPYHRDNGTRGGGATGRLLGDPGNPIFCRHVHSTVYNPIEKAFYVCTGDHDRQEGYECHWLKGVYDEFHDRWGWEIILSERQNSRYKSGGLNIVDGQLYWISDANGPTPHDRGIFKCFPADLENINKHTKLFNPRYESASMIIQDGVILAGHLSLASPYSTGVIVSLDLGKTWQDYDLKEFGNSSPTRFFKRNSAGWFKVHLKSKWIDRNEVLFIKPRTF